MLFSEKLILFSIPFFLITNTSTAMVFDDNLEKKINNSKKTSDVTMLVNLQREDETFMRLHDGLMNNHNIYSQVSDCFSSLMPTEKVHAIEPIKEGTWGGGIYRIKSTNKNYVLRFMNKVRTTDELEQERNICSLMGEAGVSPILYASSLENRVLIMDEIIGTPLLKSKLTEKQINDLGQKLKLLQTISLKKSLQKLTPMENIKKVIAVFNINLPETFQLALEELKERFSLLEQKDEYVLAHTDLNPGNICEDVQGLKIIDWEDAHVSHPYLDVATLLIFYDLEPQDLNILLNSYTKGKENTIDKKKLVGAYQVMNFLYAVKLYSISRSLPIGDEKNSHTENEEIRRLFNAKDWGALFATLNNQNKAYVLSRLYLEKALWGLSVLNRWRDFL